MKLLILAAFAWGMFSTDAHAFNTSHFGAGDGHYGRGLACGGTLRPGSNVIAHRTLPCGTRVRITNLANGRSGVGVVRDRGPAKWTGRTWDLESAFARSLGITGLGNVKAEVLK